MVLKMYSIYDKKTEIYYPPMFGHNAAHAMRIMQQQLEEKGNTIAKFPEDFKIFWVGTFNDATASILATTPVQIVCECTDLVQKEDPQDAR